MKYIDANILRKEIERRKELLKNGTGHPEVMKRVEGVIKAYNSILTLIDSLQQERPEVDLNANIEMEWDSFNKHITEYGDEVVWLNWLSFVDIANYFYELGKNNK